MAAFAAALRQLRAAAGSPSYRELSRLALFSASVLSTAASGSAFPSLPVTLAFVSACAGDTDEWRLRWEAVAASLGRLVDPGHRGAPAQSACPVPDGTARAGPGAGPPPARGQCQLPAPAELPAAAAHFIGRQDEFTQLLAIAEPGNRARTAAVVISGLVGVGKTALGLQFSHRTAPRYPDGQLYADLGVARARGETAYDVTGRFLSALGILRGQIPADAQQRTGLYRSVLSARRVMVVLDDADSEAEIRPLLAAGHSCLILVTSRRRLAGLDNVHRIVLDVLRPAETVALVKAIAGERRAAGPTMEAAMLGEWCGHLPLAVWIAATRLGTQAGRSPDSTLGRLHRAGRLLDWLRIGDVSVRDRLHAAYQRLDSPARRAFRRLSIAATADIDAAGMAVLLNDSASAADRMLEALVEAGLVQPSRATAGYHMPPLFSLFARELLNQREPAIARRLIGAPNRSTHSGPRSQGILSSQAALAGG